MLLKWVWRIIEGGTQKESVSLLCTLYIYCRNFVAPAHSQCASSLLTLYPCSTMKPNYDIPTTQVRTRDSVTQVPLLPHPFIVITSKAIVDNGGLAAY